MSTLGRQDVNPVRERGQVEMDESMGAWLDALASDTSAPGGGAAAGLLVATGAALVEMACGLTLHREKFRAVAGLMQATRARATALRARATELRAEDSAAFTAVTAAYALPRQSEAEKDSRSARIQKALHLATEVPLQTATVGAEILELAAAIAAAANPNVISDVGAAALSARAGVEASALNVRINLNAIKDAAYVQQRRGELEAVLARAEAAATKALAPVRAAIGW
jgi:formiminotetrahydrofolate cyclodeaminase